MTSPTLLCVHAHPDDEALFTAGISAHYGALGYNVVLITCTDGRLGFDAHARPGNDPRHESDATACTRAGELQRSAQLVGFTRSLMLGYRDSGMAGWAQNHEPGAFVNADVESVARLIAAVIDETNAAVVVTYDENGFYGHPDHIRANVVTRRAIELADAAQRLYYPVVPRGVLADFKAGANAQGLSLPAWILDAVPDTPDELVATVMDVTSFATQKQEAIAAHASQIDNLDLVTMDQKLFTLLFGIEYYQRAWSRHNAKQDDTDLFGGL
ncbi:MAG: GlcNAc-PI de-N-acetylase [Acidobacteria bacterium]|nr:GlcNAc-PI de-N-acetylase [Acidobacteriota bacterium]